MRTLTKADLEKALAKLQEKVATLSTEKMTKSAVSATKAALEFLSENLDDVQSVDLDTGYGHLTFKFKRG